MLTPPRWVRPTLFLHCYQSLVCQWGQPHPRGLIEGGPGHSGLTHKQFRRSWYMNISGTSPSESAFGDLLSAREALGSQGWRNGKAWLWAGGSEVGSPESWSRAQDLGFLEGKKRKGPQKEREVYFMYLCQVGEKKWALCFRLEVRCFSSIGKN